MTQPASRQLANSQEIAANRVLDMLDNWSERMSGHQTQKRSSVRKTFRSKLTLFIPELEETVGEAVDKTIIEVWARNISKSGIAFITLENIKSDEIIVCLQGAGGEQLYFHSEIVRRRQVHDQFWEYGAKLKERAHM